MPKPVIRDIVSKKQVPKASSAPQKRTPSAAPEPFDFDAPVKTSENLKKSFFTSLADKTARKSAEKEIKEEVVKKKKNRLLKFPKLKINLNSKLKIIAGLAGFGLIIFIAILFLNKMASIDVEVTLHQEFSEVSAIFNASVDPGKNELPLEVMRLTHEESGSAEPTGVKEIARKAEGKIMVYNAYSSEPQPLVKNTRFETSDGKIYRIEKSITIPGTKVVEGKIAAGEIEAAVYADKPGEEYNIGLTDFTIPGLKGSAKYEKIYGRSKTEIKGGFVGQAPVLNESDISGLKNSLREKIKDYLLKSAANPKPEEFMLYNDAKKITFEENKNTPKPGDQSDLLEMEEKGTFYGFLLKKSDISAALAEKYMNSEIAPLVTLANPEELELELKNYTENSASFLLKGKAVFIWKIDANKIKSELAAGKDDPNSVFGRFSPAIDKARITYKPSWWPFIPKDISRIHIINGQ